MMHHFAKRQGHGTELSGVVKKYMPNKQGKFDAEIFFRST